jgi:hypothetical protein
MRHIPPKAKMNALELYLQGLSTNEIVTQSGISKGAVVSIIKDAREGKFPQLDLGDRIDEPSIHHIYAALVADEARNRLILDDLLQALEEGRSPILLTERREHLEFFTTRSLSHKPLV